MYAKIWAFYADVETNWSMFELLCKQNGSQPECFEFNQMSTGW